MTFADALLLGVVEGVTEFIPVSSTGHLVLASRLLSLPNTEFLKLFEVVIQFGAIFAVLIVYGKKVSLDLEIWKRVVLAFLPTAVFGLLFYKLVKMLLGSPLVVAGSLFLGGVALVLFERFYDVREELPRQDVSTISLKNAFFVGVFQSIAIIPGVSRSAATILGGLWLGIPRKTIVEFSFLLAVPTIAAAAGLDLLQNISLLTIENLPLLVFGSFVSFAVALLSIRFFLRYISNHSFVPFGVYRILAAVAFLLL